MPSPAATVAMLMQDYDFESSDADEIALSIANDPALVAVLTPHQRHLLVLGLFDGPTGWDEEDAAMTILQGASSTDLKLIIGWIGWPKLDDELDDEDIGLLRGLTGDLADFDPTDDDADEVAIHIANNPSLLATMSVQNKVLLVQALFDGTTDQQDEDAAMAILLSMTTTDLRTAVHQITWSELISELDAEDLAELRRRTLDFTEFDPDDGDSVDVAVAIAEDPQVLPLLTRGQRASLVRAIILHSPLFQPSSVNQTNENAALAILLSEPTGEGLIQLICDVGGWPILFDRFGSDAVDKLSGPVADRLDQEWSPLRQHMPWLYDSSLKMFIDQLDNSVEAIIQAMPLMVQSHLINIAIEQRRSLLFRLGSLKRRAKTFPSEQLFHALEWMAAATGHNVSAATELGFEVRYLAAFAEDLAEADYGALLQKLPDMVDGHLPVEQRTACYEMFRHLQPELDAQRQIISKRGTLDQRNKMARFTNWLQAFSQSFNPTLSPTNVIDDLIAALEGIGEAISGGLDEIRAAISELAALLGALNVGGLLGLGTSEGSEARELIGLLSSTQQEGSVPLAHLPFTSKLKLVIACLEQFHTGDEAEIAIVKVFNATDEMDRPEFFQLMNAVGFESLDSNIQGDEWQSFLALLKCGSDRLGTSAGHLVVLKETETGRNVLFRDTWSGRVYSVDEACHAILSRRIEGYVVRHRHGKQYPRSIADRRRDNNLGRPIRSRLIQTFAA